MNPVGSTVNLPGGIPSGVAPGGAEYKTGAGPTKITEARQVNGKTYYNIDQTGIYGGTGWIDAGALGGAAPSNPNPAPAASNPTPTATPTALPSTPAPAPFDLVGATKSAFETPEIVAANKAITDRQAALAVASKNINDNPFYSEATRVGKQAQLTNEANNDIKVQQDQLAILKADAQIKVNAAQGQYNINRQAYQDTLSQFNQLMNAGGLINASGTDLANMSVSTGIPVSILQGMQQKQQQDNTKLQIIPSTDAAGNVTITTVDKNSGAIVNQVSAGDVGKGFKGTSGGGTTKPATNKYLTQATKYLASADIAATGKGTEDKLLSKDEAAKAYEQVLALVGGNQDTADAVFNQAMNAGGYGKYKW